jgi:NDP-sugar pyrophosphorylase family protein
MVLAAGVGSRLRPMTDATPKALIDVGGLPMLERALRRLEDAGASEIVVNVHHHAQKVVDFLKARRGRARVEISREDERLLDTGGGLKKAAAFFTGDEPFFVYNADVLSDVSLRALSDSHRAGAALATLFVQDRPSSRKLLFSAEGRLLGRSGKDIPPGALALGFNGIQVVAPRIFDLMTETGVFSLTDVYVRLAASQRIMAYRDDRCAWFDIGDAAKLEAARRSKL